MQSCPEIGVTAIRHLFPVVTAVLVQIAASAADATVPATQPEAACATEALAAERSYGIPAQLLHAISIVESGRHDSERRATIAWPWTVMAEGHGRYLPSKAEAIAEVRRLQAKGVQNIDVGCMQVNLRYHPDAFASLDDAFDPASNVAYAARFLKGLFGATGHWPTAASYYHSQTPSLAAVYRERLMKVWNVAGTQFASPSPAGAGLRYAWRYHQADYRAEARQIVEAWRQARLAEYRLRGHD